MGTRRYLSRAAPGWPVLLIGATVEERGFDTDLTAGGLLHLLRETWEVLPGIDELPVIETWVGFRPTSRDDAPILDRPQ